MDSMQVLAEMARELEAKRTRDEALQVVSDFAVRAFDADDAGILLLAERGGDFSTPAATTERVDQAHLLQVELDEGPCLDAIKGSATYFTADVVADERWPRWGAAAGDLGIRATIGVRLATRDRGYGSLNVYSGTVGAFDDVDAGLIEVLAAHATAALAAVTRSEGLETALETRNLIGQAQGILMQKFDIDSDAAFQFLTRISQHENIKLRAVAEAIAVQRDANARPS